MEKVNWATHAFSVLTVNLVCEFSQINLLFNSHHKTEFVLLTLRRKIPQKGLLVYWAQIHDQSPIAIVYMGALMNTAFQGKATDWAAKHLPYIPVV